MKNRLLLSICLFFTASATVFSQTGTPLPTATDLKITFTGGKPYASPGEKMDMEVSVFQINGKTIQQEVRIDLGWGFRPKQHVVSCSGTIVKVSFHKPVAGKDY